MKKVFDIKERTFQFSLEIIRLISKMPKNIVGYEVGRQLIRSGTSIGANVEEATGARTKKEFINIMNISRREARETKYWLRILKDTELISDQKIVTLIDEAEELIKILTVIIKSSQKNA
ncbi:MAG: four helix bundle protein [Candidatus Hodarchaeales archaeon]